MLEQSFGTSIRELNENGTILLGLFQTQLKETRQIRLRVEELDLRIDKLDSRVDQLEMKVDANTALLNEHTRMLGEHTRRFDRLESMLTEVLARMPEKP